MLSRWINLCIGVALAATVTAGCQSSQKKQPPQLSDPHAVLAVREFSGTTLSGELPQSIEPTVAEQAWLVTARVVATRALPTDGFENIGPYARLVLNDDSSNLMSPSARLVYSTRIHTLDASASVESLLGDAHTWTQIGDPATASVAPGTTASFELSQPQDQINRAQRQKVRVDVYRTADAKGYELAIISNDRVIGTSKTVRETVVIPRPATEKDHVVLAIPMTFDNSAVGVVFDLSIDTKPSNPHDVAAKLKKSLDASAAEATNRLKQPTVSAADMTMAAALDAVTSSGDRSRAALVFLAQQSGAALTENVALVADDQLLAVIVGAVRDRIPKLPSRDPANVSWMLDRATIDTVASIKDDTAQQSLPAVQGVLETYAGEAGQQLDLLQSLAKQSAGNADLYNRLIAEHIIYLEDNSPAARVRAFDWLHTRGLAPPGYDPLGDGKQRRAALEKYRESVAATQESAATQPKGGQ